MTDRVNCRPDLPPSGRTNGSAGSPGLQAHLMASQSQRACTELRRQFATCAAVGSDLAAVLSPLVGNLVPVPVIQTSSRQGIALASVTRFLTRVHIILGFRSTYWRYL
jgi:hypothetical protein